jgi:hypothetical protein
VAISYILDADANQLLPLLITSSKPRDPNARETAQTWLPSKSTDEATKYARKQGVPILSTGPESASDVVAVLDRIKASLTRRLNNGAPLPALVERPEYAQWYERLGRWTGPYGSRKAQEELLEQWRKEGWEGAAWIVPRLLDEHHLDAIAGASNALVRIGESAVPHLVAALEIAVTREVANPTLTLLRVLRDFDQIHQWTPRIRPLLRRLVSHFDTDVREAAYYLIAEALDEREAINLLTTARSSETDLQLRDLLTEMLERRN